MQPRVAVLVDLAFFLQHFQGNVDSDDAPAMATALHQGALRTQGPGRQARGADTRHELYRVFCYDARPLGGTIEDPATGEPFDLAETAQATFRSGLHDALRRKRKVALRLGSLAPARPQWQLRPRATRDLREGRRTVGSLGPADFALDVRQHGVELRLGMDVAALAYKRLVDRMVLVTADAEVVAATKLARREGVDVVLDPMGASVSPRMAEHVDGVQGYMQPTSPGRGAEGQRESRDAAREVPASSE